MASFTPPPPLSLELILGLCLASILFIAGIKKLLRPASAKQQQQQQEEEEEVLKLPLPPGRFGLPFIGETLEYLATQRAGQPWKFFDDRVARFGPTFRTSLVMLPTVVLASPSGNKAAFSSSNTSWPAGVVAILGADSLIGRVGPRAARIRTALAMLLQPESMQKYTGVVDMIAARFMQEHLPAAAEQHRILLFPLMKKLTFSIACQVLMGRADKDDQALLLHPFTALLKGILQLPINIPGTRYHKALAASETIRKQLQAWIDEASAALDAGLLTENQHILSSLLKYTDEHGKPLSHKEIKDNIILLLFAGHNTSTVVASMTCKYLASNPGLMDEVYRENKEIAQSKAPHDQLLKWADIQKMKLSWRVVQESMRLMHPVQVSFRRAPHEMSFNGFRIPKSWQIMWSPNSTHRNPKYFPDPLKFDPSRFEGSGPAPFTFVPFGGGPRMCPGNEFGRMEILVILRHLVTRFSWTLEDPDELITVDPMPHPTKGLPIILKPRNA